MEVRRSALVYSQRDELSASGWLRAGLELAWRAGPAWLCLAASIVLALFGMFAIDVAESLRAPQTGLIGPTALRHGTFAVLGVCVMACTAIISYRRIGPWSVVIYAASIVPLLFLLVPGMPASIVRPRGGARSWIDIGPIDFQPSELTKVACIFLLAWYLRYKKNHRTLKGLMPPALITGVPMGLIMLQPDLGTAMLFVPALFFVLIAAGAKIKHLVIAVLCAMLCAPAVYPILKPHQQQRIVGLFLQVKGDDREDLDINMQQVASQRLIGAGGLLGQSEEESRALLHFNALPERHNDMVFAPVVLRFGLLGGLALLVLCGLWCVGALATAATCGEPFGRLLCIGAAGFFLAQTVINIGMNVGLLPVIGITLPFVSHGGSSMLTQWIMTGLVLNVALRRSAGYEFGLKRAFEDEDDD